MIETGGDKPHAPFVLDGRVAAGLVEMKVEVFWGRVYGMLLDGSTLFLRNSEVEDYTPFMGAVLHMPPKDKPRTAWIRDGGYLDCVIETAERVAHAAHIDYVRVDIFLDKGDPKGCAVNEISFSSRYAYHGHEQYMAKVWAGPLHDKLYKPFKDSATPVYELTTETDQTD